MADAFFHNSQNDGSWSNADNWSSDSAHSTPLGSVPTTGDVVSIDSACSTNLPATLDMASIVIIAGGSLTIPAATTVECVITQLDGASVIVANTGTLTFGAGSGWVANSSTSYLDIQGAVIIASNVTSYAGYFNVSGTLTVNAGSTLEMLNESNSPVILFTGTIEINGTLVNDSLMEGPGTINISGILLIRKDANLLEGGAINVADGGELALGNHPGAPTTVYLLMSAGTTLNVVTGGKLTLFGDASLDLYPSATEGGSTNVVNSPPSSPPLRVWW